MNVEVTPHLPIPPSQMETYLLKPYPIKICLQIRCHFSSTFPSLSPTRAHTLSLFLSFQSLSFLPTLAKRPTFRVLNSTGNAKFRVDLARFIRFFCGERSSIFRDDTAIYKCVCFLLTLLTQSANAWPPSWSFGQCKGTKKSDYTHRFFLPTLVPSSLPWFFWVFVVLLNIEVIKT